MNIKPLVTRNRQLLSLAAAAAIALLMVALMLAPDTAWRHPANDAVYEGVDRNLLYLDPKGPGMTRGQASSTPQLIELNALAGSKPTAILLTTPMRRIVATMDLQITSTGRTPEAVRVGWLSARSGSGHFLIFGSEPRRTISSESIVRAGVVQTLVGGHVTHSVPLGNYALGARYHVMFDLDKTAGTLTEHITGTELAATDVVRTADAQELLESVRLSLTASADAIWGSRTEVQLTNLVITLPHESFWANKTNDAVLSDLLVALLVLGLVLIAGTALAAVGSCFSRASWRGLSFPSRGRLVVGGCLAGLSGVTLLIGIWLSPLASHPFDMLSEKIWSYVGVTYGADELYYLPGITTLADVWRGSPYHEAVFPYEPVMGYLFITAGYVQQLASPHLLVASRSLEYAIKGLNLLFTVADGLLIFGILRKLRTGLGWSLTGAALFLLNPAILFSAAIWGTTQVVSITFLLAGVWFMESERRTFGWIMLVLGVLTRPQMLIAVFLLGMAFLLRDAFTKTLRSGSLGIITAFLSIAPFTLRISPSLPLDFLRSALKFQEGGGNERVLSTVSLDVDSIWTLLTGLIQHQRGLRRIFIESDTPLLGSLTYQKLSAILVVAVLFSVVAWLALARRQFAKGGAYLPIVAVGLIAFLLLQTGLASTHFVLALPFLILLRPWLRGPIWLCLVLAWTATTLIPMFGSLEQALLYGNNQGLPLYPSRSPIGRTFIALYADDRMITIGALVNAAVLAVVVATAVRESLIRDRLAIVHPPAPEPSVVSFS